MRNDEHVEPFEMNDAERQTDALLDAALSAEAFDASCKPLAERICAATREQLPGAGAVPGAVSPVIGRIDPSTAAVARRAAGHASGGGGGGLSTAWRIAAVIAMGLMTAMVVAAWQVDVSAPQVARADSGMQKLTPDSQTAQTDDHDALPAIAVTLPGAGSTDIDADLDMLALQVEMLSSSEVFGSADDSLDEAVSLDQLDYWSSNEPSALF